MSSLCEGLLEEESSVNLWEVSFEILRNSRISLSKWLCKGKALE